MNVRSPHRDGPELLVDREYEASRDEVLRTVRSKLQAAGVELDDADLEAAYNQAWHALYLMLADGERIENRIAMLVTITHRRSLDDHRALRVDRRAELDPQLPAPRPDVERRLDQQRQLRALRTGMRERLNGRELQAATLCYIHQRSRPEAAEIMGLSPRRMEKIMDRVSKRFGELVRDVQGDWCAAQGSLVQAYALGVLDPDGERHQLALDHLADCPSCRRRVLGLRGLAAVAPPVPLLVGGGGLAGGGVVAGSGGSDRAGDGGAAGSTSGAAGSPAAGVAGAAGAAGARGAGRVLGRLGRGSGRANLVAAGAVTATIAVAATALALSSGDSDPHDGARPGGGATSTSSGADRGTRNGSSAGSRRADASGRTATTARPSSAAASGKRSSRATGAARGAGSAAAASRSAASGGSASALPNRSGSGTTTTGGGSTATAPATPTTTPARPSTPSTGATPNGTGSAAATPPKAATEVVEDGAEEFELH